MLFILLLMTQIHSNDLQGEGRGVVGQCQYQVNPRMNTQSLRGVTSLNDVTLDSPIWLPSCKPGARYASEYHRRHPHYYITTLVKRPT
ncbi:hypothetical protein CDAR_565601 [Caerostris darwini]|uniref:Secreted protein n=1 Tax=Caerostris darwini TaxID=1538125 RepID=A0AAV4UZM1_9ARAC|nr:hypothetical protein CDAR_565601 [Caerostris darwini]